MERGLLRLLAVDGSRILEERDVGGVPGPSTYVLRLEVERWTEDFREAPELGVCIFFSFLTLGLSYLPCVDTRNANDHSLEVTARLFLASGAEVRRVAEDGSGEIELRVDTTERTPLLRRTYRVDLQTGLGRGEVSGAELDRFERAEAERLAELLYDQIAPDLARAIDGSATAPATSATSPAVSVTAGSETVLGQP